MMQAMNEFLVEFGVDMSINHEQAAQLIRYADLSGEGKVNKQEFLRMLKILLRAPTTLKERAAHFPNLQ